MTHAKAALLILTRMALSDGQLVEEELESIEEMKTFLGLTDKQEDIVEEARGTTVEDLVQFLPKYEDRFFIAMRSYSMAMIDENFDHQEEALFDKMIALLEISDKHKNLIIAFEDGMDADSQASAELMALYTKSSFAS